MISLGLGCAQIYSEGKLKFIYAVIIKHILKTFQWHMHYNLIIYSYIYFDNLFIIVIVIYHYLWYLDKVAYINIHIHTQLILLKRLTDLNELNITVNYTHVVNPLEPRSKFTAVSSNAILTRKYFKKV